MSTIKKKDERDGGGDEQNGEGGSNDNVNGHIKVIWKNLRYPASELKIEFVERELYFFFPEVNMIINCGVIFSSLQLDVYFPTLMRSRHFPVFPR